MNKRSWIMMILSLFLLTLNSCNKLHIANGQSGLADPPSIEKAREVLQSLAETNVEWHSVGMWVHYQAIPSDTGTLPLTTHDRWTLFDNDGRMLKDFYRISQEGGSREIQRFIMIEPGIRGELFELRQKGLKALAYAIPKEQNMTIKDISMVNQDLRYLEIVESVLTRVYVSEELIDQHQVITLTIEIIGHSEEKKAGIPPGKLGRKEEFTYDKQTGQRIKYARSFLDDTNQWEEPSYVNESVQFTSEIPEDVLNEYQESEKELDFYIKLFQD